VINPKLFQGQFLFCPAKAWVFLQTDFIYKADKYDETGPKMSIDFGVSAVGLVPVNKASAML